MRGFCADTSTKASSLLVATMPQRLIPTESMNILSYDVCHCFAGYFFVDFDPHTIDRNFVAGTLNHAAIEHVADSN